MKTKDADDRELLELPDDDFLDNDGIFEDDDDRQMCYSSIIAESELSSVTSSRGCDSPLSMRSSFELLIHEIEDDCLEDDCIFSLEM